MKFLKMLHKAKNKYEDLKLALIEWIQSESGESVQLPSLFGNEIIENKP